MGSGDQPHFTGIERARRQTFAQMEEWPMVHLPDKPVQTNTKSPVAIVDGPGVHRHSPMYHFSRGVSR
jgi:hypothetical protein